MHMKSFRHLNSSIVVSVIHMKQNKWINMTISIKAFEMMQNANKSKNEILLKIFCTF